MSLTRRRRSTPTPTRFVDPPALSLDTLQTQHRPWTLPYLRASQNPNEVVWFDVGVFRSLFSEVSHYFLPADSDHAAPSINPRSLNIKEVSFTFMSRLVYRIIQRFPPHGVFLFLRLCSSVPTEEASRAPGLPGQREAGTGAGSDLQVQSRRNQLLRTGSLQPHQRVQDLPARVPRSALCCQDHQGGVHSICKSNLSHQVERCLNLEMDGV